MNVPLLQSSRPESIDDLIAFELAKAERHAGCAFRACANARRVRPECLSNPWIDAAREHVERAEHHRAVAIGWGSR